MLIVMLHLAHCARKMTFCFKNLHKLLETKA